MDITDTPTPEPEVPPEEPKQESPRGARVLREWGFDIDQFRSRAKVSLDAARGDLSEVTAALRQAVGETRQVLLDLQRTRGPVAAELKGGFERAWDEIEKAFRSARQRMREAQAAPEKAEPEPEPPPPPPVDLM
jgi:hypothetical protein